MKLYKHVEPADIEDIKKAAKDMGYTLVRQQELESISKLLGAWSSHYAEHVYDRGGNGDASDLISYVKKHIEVYE